MFTQNQDKKINNNIDVVKRLQKEITDSFKNINDVKKVNQLCEKIFQETTNKPSDSLDDKDNNLKKRLITTTNAFRRCYDLNRHVPLKLADRNYSLIYKNFLTLIYSFKEKPTRSNIIIHRQIMYSLYYLKKLNIAIETTHLKQLNFILSFDADAIQLSPDFSRQLITCANFTSKDFNFNIVNLVKLATDILKENIQNQKPYRDEAPVELLYVLCLYDCKVANNSKIQDDYLALIKELLKLSNELYGKKCQSINALKTPKTLKNSEEEKYAHRMAMNFIQASYYFIQRCQLDEKLYIKKETMTSLATFVNSTSDTMISVTQKALFQFLKSKVGNSNYIKFALETNENSVISNESKLDLLKLGIRSDICCELISDGKIYARFIIESDGYDHLLQGPDGTLLKQTKIKYVVIDYLSNNHNFQVLRFNSDHCHPRINVNETPNFYFRENQGSKTIPFVFQDSVVEFANFLIHLINLIKQGITDLPLYEEQKDFMRFWNKPEQQKLPTLPKKINAFTEEQSSMDERDETSDVKDYEKPWENTTFILNDIFEEERSLYFELTINDELLEISTSAINIAEKKSSEQTSQPQSASPPKAWEKSDENRIVNQWKSNSTNHVNQLDDNSSKQLDNNCDETKNTIVLSETVHQSKKESSTIVQEPSSNPQTIATKKLVAGDGGYYYPTQNTSENQYLGQYAMPMGQYYMAPYSMGIYYPQVQFQYYAPYYSYPVNSYQQNPGTTNHPVQQIHQTPRLFQPHHLMNNQNMDAKNQAPGKESRQSPK